MDKKDKSVGKIEFLFDTSRAIDSEAGENGAHAVSPYLNRPLRTLREAIADLETEGLGDYGDLMSPAAPSLRPSKAQTATISSDTKTDEITAKASQRVERAIFDSQARQLRGLNKAEEPKSEPAPTRRAVNQ